LVSYLDGGTNCNFPNGCGVHIHNGTSCYNSTRQGGHYYDQSKVSTDPWQYTMYTPTTGSGAAYFTGCVDTGIEASFFVNRAFIIHSDNGTRLSCGILTGATDGPTHSSHNNTTSFCMESKIDRQYEILPSRTDSSVACCTL
jgi:hypothetical protein